MSDLIPVEQHHKAEPSKDLSMHWGKIVSSENGLEYDYFWQSMGGSGNNLDQLVSAMRRNEFKFIRGMIFSDGTALWAFGSDYNIIHDDIARTYEARKSWVKRTGKFLITKETSLRAPAVHIWQFDDVSGDEMTDFLLRSLEDKKGIKVVIDDDEAERVKSLFLEDLEEKAA